MHRFAKRPSDIIRITLFLSTLAYLVLNTEVLLFKWGSTNVMAASEKQFEPKFYLNEFIGRPVGRPSYVLKDFEKYPWSGTILRLHMPDINYHHHFTFTPY